LLSARFGKLNDCGLVAALASQAPLNGGEQFDHPKRLEQIVIWLQAARLEAQTLSRDYKHFDIGGFRLIGDSESASIR
jgi:hypothetical protein